MRPQLETSTYKDLPGIGKNIMIYFLKSNAPDMYKIAPIRAVGDDAASLEKRRSMDQLMQQIEETLKRVPKE
jgi:hypothetical protein